MAVPRGGDSIFPFPIKMEEQLLTYEQRCPSRCFLSNPAISPLHPFSSSQAAPALNYSRQSREVSLWNSFSIACRKTPATEQPKGDRVKQRLPEVLTVSSDRLPPPPLTAPHPGEQFELDLFILRYIFYRHSWICWEEAFAETTAKTGAEMQAHGGVCSVTCQR